MLYIYRSPQTKGKFLFTCVLVFLIFSLSVGNLHLIKAIRDLPQGVEPVPPHPDLVERLKQAGYDSVTIVNMLSTPAGVDEPEAIRGVVTGTKKAIVLLIEFPDKVSDGVSTTSLYDSLLFSDGTYASPGSMRDFYQKNSYGNFDVTGTVSGWFQAGHDADYYAKDDGTHNKGFGPFPENAAGLVTEAVNAADSVVNFADFAENGEVKSLFVVHAGQGAEVSYPSDLIWSHKSSLTDLGGSALTVDNVTVNVYSIEPEFIYNAGDSTMGVFAHEYGHVLGLPDLYDTNDGAKVGTTLGQWSLMAGGSWNGTNGNSPASLDAWSKSKLGWITPTIVRTNLAGQLIMPAYNQAVAYKLWKNGKPGKEYFLIENRQKTGFDSTLPGSGLLIYHVDENKSDNKQQCIKVNNWNCGSTHAMIALEQADALFDMEKKVNDGDDKDPFPGTSNKLGFDFSSSPNSSSYGSSANTLVKGLNITASGSGFKVTLEVGIPTPKSPNSAIPDKTPKFTWVKETGATQYRLQVKSGIFPVYAKIVEASACGPILCIYTPTNELGLKTYQWRVQAKVEETWRPYSPYKSFTVFQPGFTSTFTSNANGWTARKGQWQVINGQYKAFPPSTGSFSSSSHEGIYSTLTYAARTKFIGCWYWCTAHLSIRGTPLPLDSVGRWHKEYKFTIDSDGYFSVWIVNPTLFALQGWTYSPYINKTGYNTVKVTAEGSDLQFYINDHLVWSGSDPNLTKGSVGLGFLGNAGSNLLVDWAKVTPSVTASPVVTIDENNPGRMGDSDIISPVP